MLLFNKLPYSQIPVKKPLARAKIHHCQHLTSCPSLEEGTLNPHLIQYTPSQMSRKEFSKLSLNFENLVKEKDWSHHQENQPVVFQYC